MKAKILGFFCSLLIVNFAIGQAIDGKLYTPFNNYYQWIGGKFNNNLNIPKITATTGRDTGGIRYNLADSSVYVWTGTQWVKVGGSNLTFSNGLTKSGDDVKLGGTLTEEATIITGNNKELVFDSLRFIVKPDGGNPRLDVNKTAVNIGTLYSYPGPISGNSFITVQADTIDQNYIEIRSTKQSNSSGIYTYSDSIHLDPQSGIISINNLASTNDTTTHKPIVYDPASKRMKYKTNWNNTDTAIVVKAYVTNAESFTITKGQVVYIFGAQGDRASVKLAKNTSDTFSSKTLGIVRADIAAGQAGWITTQGQVSGINLGAYTAGDILWLDSVAGGFTKTKPVAPKHGVFIGVVERANAGNGIIYVKPQNGVELSEVHDVLITSPTNNQVLSYTASTGIWENKTVSASIFAYTAKTTTYTAGAEDYVIHCTSGTFSVNLPTAVGITGKVYIIKNSGSGLITIDPNGSQTIDGVTTYTMGQAESVQVISTGSNWITL